jgi:xylose isomerase
VTTGEGIGIGMLGYAFMGKAHSRVPRRLLGHQHANSGWGDFDDDNMVGATAFMETLELAVELRRAGYGDNGERLGFDLYPYTEDAVEAVRRSVVQWNLIDDVAGRIDGAALREAQQAKDAVRAYELVYAALGAG